MEEKIIKELIKLSRNERLLLVEALWDSIITDPEQVELPPHHKEILEKRLQSLEQDAGKGVAWSEVREKYLR